MWHIADRRIRSGQETLSLPSGKRQRKEASLLASRPRGSPPLPSSRRRSSLSTSTTHNVVHFEARFFPRPFVPSPPPSNKTTKPTHFTHLMRMAFSPMVQFTQNETNDAQEKNRKRNRAKDDEGSSTSNTFIKTRRYVTRWRLRRDGSSLRDWLHLSSHFGRCARRLSSVLG